MTDADIPYTFGWVPDVPDIRDYSPEHKKIVPLIKGMKLNKPSRMSLPPGVDLREWCPPVKNQLGLGSCPAQASTGLVEYFVKKVYNKRISLSRLFVYKSARNLLGWTGDQGAYARTAMGALVLFGAPPEKYWPYTDKPGGDPAGFDREPPPFCYAFGQAFKTLKYYRLDPDNATKPHVLETIKSHIAVGIPSMFGIPWYDSFRQAEATGKIPFPCAMDKLEDGHIMMAVGYDNGLEITNKNCNITTKGAFLIQNSWGKKWGDEGFGWLPYDFVLRGLAMDWWTITKNEYVELGVFSL